MNRRRSFPKSRLLPFQFSDAFLKLLNAVEEPAFAFRHFWRWGRLGGVCRSRRRIRIGAVVCKRKCGATREQQQTRKNNSENRHTHLFLLVSAGNESAMSWMICNR